MIPCPSCSRTDYHETRQCPKHEGKPVCTSCCKKCNSYNSENFRCGYYILNPVKAEPNKKKALEHKMEKLQKQIDYYYRNNRPWVARKIEAEYMRTKAIYHSLFINI